MPETEHEVAFEVTLTCTNRGRPPEPDDVWPALNAQCPIWASDGIDVTQVHVEKIE